MTTPAGLELSSERLDERTAVLRIGGEVDLYTAPQVKEKILGLVDAGVRRLVVDLSHTEYLDSTALGVLVGALKRLREQDGDLRLVGPRPRIRKLLEITRLLKVFEVRDSVASAVEGWNEGRAAP